MGRVLEWIGCLTLGAAIMFLIMHFGVKDNCKTSTKVATVIERIPCPKQEIEIDSIAIYEIIRKGKLRKTKPGKVSTVVENKETEPEIKLDSYVYEDSLIYIGESVLYQGSILDFSRSIRLDTLTLERTFTKYVTQTEIVEVEKPVETIKYVTEERFNILAGAGVDVWPQFRVSASAGFQTKKDHIFLYEYTVPSSNTDPSGRAIHSLKAIVPIRFNNN